MSILATAVKPIPPRIPELTTADLSVDFVRILQTQSVTYHTENMATEIIRQLEGIAGVHWQKDPYGNIYAKKGKGIKGFPTFVSHIDTVHPIKETYEIYRSPAGHYTAMSWDKNELTQAGIGGDDKCGIILCLELLHRLTNVKCVFFLDEESPASCKGSTNGILEFFSDSRYAIQIDRKGSGDIITCGNGTELCSTEFKELLDSPYLGGHYQYKSTTGANTDVVKLKERGLGISVVNLSAGYYNPHRKDEYIVESALLNCLEFCLAISKILTVYPHKYVKPAVKAYTLTPQSHSSYQGQLNYTEKMTCAECQEDLPFNCRHDYICSTCVRIMLLNKKLVIEDGGKMRLETDLIVLEPLYAEHLPLEKCVSCESFLDSVEFKSRGYCETCANCENCQQPITSYEGLIMKACELCLNKVNVSNVLKQPVLHSTESNSEYCAEPGCPNPLIHWREKDDQMCETCMAGIKVAIY